MKKTALLILLAIMVFTLTACKNDNLQSFRYNENGDLIGIYESGKEKNFGNNQNQDYQIVDYYFNDISELIIVYKNGIESNLGNIKNNDESLELEDKVLYKNFVLVKKVDNTYAIKHYVGTDIDIIIPSDYKGVPITEVMTAAIFINHPNKTDVINMIIGKNIETISMSGIGSEYNPVNLSFEKGSKLQYLQVGALSIDVVNDLLLPEGLITIESSAFTTSHNISVYIPDSVIKIGELYNIGKAKLYTNHKEVPIGWSTDNNYLYNETN